LWKQYTITENETLDDTYLSSFNIDFKLHICFITENLNLEIIIWQIQGMSIEIHFKVSNGTKIQQKPAHDDYSKMLQLRPSVQERLYEE
jgi:hypothetical protein